MPDDPETRTAADATGAHVREWRARERSLFRALRRAQDDVYEVLDRGHARDWPAEDRAGLAEARARVSASYDEYLAHLRAHPRAGVASRSERDARG